MSVALVTNVNQVRCNNMALTAWLHVVHIVACGKNNQTLDQEIFKCDQSESCIGCLDRKCMLFDLVSEVTI